MEKSKIKKLTFSGLMIALVFLATFSIKIPIPFTQGYIHAGDSMIFVAAILFGWKFGALTGGVGSALADLLGGYAHWALPTLIIKAVMGALVGLIAHDLRNGSMKGQSAVVSTAAAAIWFGFSYFLRNTLSNAVTAKSAELVGEVEGAGTIEELILLSQKLQGQLLWISILLPLITIVLAFYLHKLDRNLFAVDQLLGMMVSGLWMVFGYYVAAGFMYGSLIVPIFSIPWNILQFVMGLIIAYLLILGLNKTPVPKYLE